MSGEVARITKPDPISIDDASARLHRPPALIRKWISRYQVRKLATIGGRLYCDYADLATIDGCLHRGERVPATPEARDEHREQLRAAYRNAA